MNSLYHRLLYIALLPTLLLTMVLAAYFSTAGFNAIEAQLYQRGKDIVRYMAPSSEYGIISGNRQSLQSMIQSAVQDPDVLAAAVYDHQGKIIAVTGMIHIEPPFLQHIQTAPSHIASGPNWLAFAAPVHASNPINDPLFDDLLSAAPPTKTNAPPAPIGYIVVEIDSSSLSQHQRELLWRGLTILLIALIITAILVTWMTKNLMRPINHLANAAKAMANGALETRVQANRHDELGALQTAFNQMAEHISEAQKTLHLRIDEATAQLAYQARHDALTGLINRREFETRLESIIKMAQNGGDPASVLFIDLDKFKKVNDSCGHMAGDELLRRVSRQLQHRLRDSDTLARIGGDEFAVLLPGTQGENALRLAQSLCDLVAAFRFPWDDKVFSIGASIGLVEVNADSESVSSVLSAGDSACYAAKAGGRNRVETFEYAPLLQQRSSDQNSRRERLESALDEEHIGFQITPIASAALEQDSHVRTLLELEALVTLDNSTPAIRYKLLQDTAERAEICHLFDLKLIDAAISLLSTATPLALPIALRTDTEILLPIAGASIRRSDFLASLSEKLSALGPAQANRLCLLISEEIAIQNPADVRALKQIIQDHGCQLGLDDFGGWMSSFAHLQNLQPRFVRMTLTLTRQISEHRHAAVLVRAIQDIARDNAIKTIATEVSREEDRQTLADLGVDYLQGPVISHPTLVELPA